jgi:hypothetical protein
MLRRNISGRRRRRNLAGATNGQLRFNTTVAGWTVTSPPHSYFFLWNPLMCAGDLHGHFN